MTPSGYLAYTAPGSVNIEQILAKIAARFSVREEPELPVDGIYLDTFDWRLYTHGLVLRRNAALFFLGLLDGSPVAEASGPLPARPFWWDFPEGEVRERLAGCTGRRALCPLLQIVGRNRRFRLCNREEKTVLCLTWQSGEVCGDTGGSGVLPPVLRLDEIRGYRKSLRQVGRLLEKNGLQPVQAPADVLQSALGVINRRPGDYSSKFSVALQPEYPVSRAIQLIGLHLHAALDRNLPGLLKDIDPEFLHDFRVALRRIRSLLSQLRQVLPPGQAGLFREGFRWLGSATGPVRDLDICLAREERYRKLVPERLQEGLAVFFRDLRQLREGRLRAMRDELQSARAVRLLEDWRDFLHALPDDIDWPEGRAPSREVAQKALRKSLRRLINAAERVIREEDGDEAIHALRIRGKKFRYLTEFFRSLFPDDAMEALLRRLHDLQDDLGDFNDLSVQLRGLQAHRDNPETEPTVRESLAALVSQLADERKRLRAHCLQLCGSIARMKKSRFA